MSGGGEESAWGGTGSAGEADRHTRAAAQLSMVSQGGRSCLHPQPPQCCRGHSQGGGRHTGLSHKSLRWQSHTCCHHHGTSCGRRRFHWARMAGRGQQDMQNIYDAVQAAYHATLTHMGMSTNTYYSIWEQPLIMTKESRVQIHMKESSSTAMALTSHNSWHDYSKSTTGKPFIMRVAVIMCCGTPACDCTTTSFKYNTASI